MQVESFVRPVFRTDTSIEETRFSSSEPVTSDPVEFVQPLEDSKPRESKLDLISAAIVHGFTGAFMAFIFGLVTDYIPSKFDNLLLSVFMGLCVGVIAYALMKEDQ